MIQDIAFLDQKNQIVQKVDATFDVANGNLFSENFFIQGKYNITSVQYTILDPNNKNQLQYQVKLFQHPFINQSVISTCVGQEIQYHQYTPTKQNYHKDLKLSDLLDVIGMANQNCSIKIDNQVFKGDKLSTLGQLKISAKTQLIIDDNNFKSIAFLISAQGCWDQNLLDYLQLNRETWINQQTQETRQLNIDKVLTTLLGLSILQKQFSANYAEWKMIERKAIAYVKRTIPNLNNDVKELLGQIKL